MMISHFRHIKFIINSSSRSLRSLGRVKKHARSITKILVNLGGKVAVIIKEAMPNDIYHLIDLGP
ncbi:hypothetical protein GCM10027295_13500 [Pseudaeromonas pectinilytica]